MLTKKMVRIVDQVALSEFFSLLIVDSDAALTNCFLMLSPSVAQEAQVEKGSRR